MIYSSIIFIPVVAMSITVCSIGTKTVADSLGVDHPAIIHGPLSRRGTWIEALIAGNPATTIRSSLTDKLNNDDHNGIESQAVIYSNSKTNAEGSLLNMATKVLYKTHKDNTELTFADLLTGGDGIKRKTCTMAAITNYTLPGGIMRTAAGQVCSYYTNA